MGALIDRQEFKNLRILRHKNAKHNKTKHAVLKRIWSKISIKESVVYVLYWIMSATRGNNFFNCNKLN
jgi:hypothetical protein